LSEEVIVHEIENSDNLTGMFHSDADSQFQESERVGQGITNGVQNSSIALGDISNDNSDSIMYYASLSVVNEITNSRPPASIMLKPPLHFASRGRPKKERNKHPIDIFIDSFKKRSNSKLVVLIQIYLNFLFFLLF
jgi:hypothetical protein